MADLNNIKLPLVDDEYLAECERSFNEWLYSNPNNYDKWSVVKNATNVCVCFPKTVTLDVPADIRRNFAMDYGDADRKVIKEWVELHLDNELSEFVGKKFFLKNSCFSNKFNFKDSCLIPEEWTVDVIVEHMIEIQMTSMAFDTGGLHQFLLREYIEPADECKTIYNGMPFRPEMRLFYDFTNHKRLYEVFYWNWNYCHPVIVDNGGDDVEVYESEYNRIYRLYAERSHHFREVIDVTLEQVNGLEGIWSVDFILEDKRVWLIDMAVGANSAYYNPEKIFSDESR